MSFKRSLLKKLNDIQQTLVRLENALNKKSRTISPSSTSQLFKIIKNMSFKELLIIIQVSLAISAFFAAVEYFSIEPQMSVIDVEMGVPEKDRLIYKIHNEEKFREFYEKFNLRIPEIILKDKNLNSLLLTDIIPERHYLMNKFLSVPEIDFINDIICKDNVLDDENINILINSKFAGGLENRLFQDKYEKHLYSTKEDSILEENQLKEMIKFLKPKLTNIEYYLFVNAILYSREYSSSFWIKNTGKINLSEIMVTIYPPTSSLTQKRTGNISEFEVLSDLPHKIDQSDDKVIINIPELKPGKLISLRIKTIENRLTASDMYYTFKGTKVINRPYYFILAICVISLFVILRVLFTTKSKNINGSSF